MTFVIGGFQFYSKSEHKQVKWNKTTGNLPVFFVTNKVVQNLNDFWNLFLYKVYLKNESDNSSREKKCSSFNFFL